MVSIDVRGACVNFPIFDAKARSLKKTLLGTVGRAGGKIGIDAKVPVIEALRNVSLSLRHGDRVGLIGNNGAGKSTLLRLLSGIYEPTTGSARIVGKVAPVFDLGVGMDPEISGYENIIIRGLFLGMTRKQMESRAGEIAEFSELGDYLSMPLRTYSTGMRVRLALGVVTSINPEILLLDEGIGAVDAAFLEKARDRFTALVERSGILVFASHSEEFLLELCTSGLWLERGEIHEEGELRQVLSHYKNGDRVSGATR
jgi:ABC-2 type transport system ATP-binding protein